ncbi:hypothetical protein D3C80_1784430 [compost metagenome]
MPGIGVCRNGSRRIPQQLQHAGRRTERIDIGAEIQKSAIPRTIEFHGRQQIAAVAIFFKHAYTPFNLLSRLSQSLTQLLPLSQKYVNAFYFVEYHFSLHVYFQIQPI